MSRILSRIEKGQGTKIEFVTESMDDHYVVTVVKVFYDGAKVSRNVVLREELASNNLTVAMNKHTEISNKYRTDDSVL